MVSVAGRVLEALVPEVIGPLSVCLKRLALKGRMHFMLAALIRL